MTLSQVQNQFEYWRKHPPAHDLLAGFVGYKAPLTIEEQWAQGVMGPEDFVAWVQSTDGKQVSPGG
jgi:hypothetical protein